MKDRRDVPSENSRRVCTTRLEERDVATSKRNGEQTTDTARPPVDFVDPRSTPFIEPLCRGELPHLYKQGGTYFVTFRQFDAVILRAPRGMPDRGRPNPEEVAAASEPPLHSGSCALGKPEIAQVVQDAIGHFDGARYDLSAWCVMPNHAHVVFTPRGAHSPSAILHSWKSFTAHQIANRFGLPTPIWERESFDHLIRSAADWERFIRYVEENPVVANLCTSAEAWPFSSARGRHARASLEG
ncbi:MAG: transposase [Isosphaeraceae bacterium]